MTMIKSENTREKETRKMATMMELAEEIIKGRRITKDDDLSIFLTCDLDELRAGADKIREYFIGDQYVQHHITQSRMKAVRSTMRTMSFCGNPNHKEDFPTAAHPPKIRPADIPQ